MIGIWGGYLVGRETAWGERGHLFRRDEQFCRKALTFMGITKSLSFGLIVSWVCCYKGFFTEFGAKGVGKATTQSVVISSVLILIWDYFITSISL